MPRRRSAGRSGRCTNHRRFFAPRWNPGSTWTIDGSTRLRAVSRSLAIACAAAACYVAGALVDEGVGTIEDTDIGARVGLRWRRGPVRADEPLRNRARQRSRRGFRRALEHAVPAIIDTPGARRARPFRFTLVRSEIADGIATLTINRPDAMNALNEAVVSQLEDAFHAAADESGGQGHRHRGQRQGLRRRRRHPVLRPAHRGRHNRRRSRSSRGAARRSCGRSRRAQSRSSRGSRALRSEAASSSRSRATRSSPRRRRHSRFPRLASESIRASAGRSGRTRRVGRGLAKWLVLTGQTVGAEEALAIGLIDTVVPYERARCRHRRSDRQRPRDRSRSNRFPTPIVRSPSSSIATASTSCSPVRPRRPTTRASRKPSSESAPRRRSRSGSRPISSIAARPANRRGSRAGAVSPRRDLCDEGRLRGVVEPGPEGAGVRRAIVSVSGSEAQELRAQAKTRFRAATS